MTVTNERSTERRTNLPNRRLRCRCLPRQPHWNITKHQRGQLRRCQTKPQTVDNQCKHNQPQRQVNALFRRQLQRTKDLEPQPHNHHAGRGNPSCQMTRHGTCEERTESHCCQDQAGCNRR